jgi:hypothetical protein
VKGILSALETPERFASISPLWRRSHFVEHDQTLCLPCGESRCSLRDKKANCRLRGAMIDG